MSDDPTRILNRREMLATAALTAGTALIAKGAQRPERSTQRPVPCLFTKPLHNRPFKDLPVVLNELDVNAVDLTCRKAGHVAPERAAEDLPAAVEQLKNAGISVTMVTTEITDAGKDHAETIVRTVASLGIGFVKLGYYSYGDLHNLHQQLAEVKARLRDLAALCGHYKVRAGFHNHSGMTIGAPMWDLWQLLRDLPADQIGSYFDLRHATVEGSEGGWRIGLALLAPRIIMVSVKDCIWQKEPKGWRVKDVPLGQGAVRVEEGFRQLKDAGFAGPVSLHVEYASGNAAVGSDEDKQKLESIRRDWLILADLMKAVGW